MCEFARARGLLRPEAFIARVHLTEIALLASTVRASASQNLHCNYRLANGAVQRRKQYNVVRYVASLSDRLLVILSRDSGAPAM